MIIKDVEIQGFWGRMKAVANIFTDVTIFIGLNGTGKTTFISLIAAALTVDIIQLDALQFESIIINLVDPKKRTQRKINVSRQQTKTPFNIYEYKIGQKSYSVPIEPRVRRYVNETYIDGRIEQIYRRLSPEVRREYLELKKELSSLVEVSQISVYRQSYSENIEADPRQRSTAVDDRLQRLIEQFARYQLKLETQLNDRSTKFQQDAIASLLYNEEFDDFNIGEIEEILEIDLETQGEKLSRAFKELGIEGKANQIQKHIDKLRNAIQGLMKGPNKDGTNILPEDVVAFPLIRRTNKIIDLLNKSEEDKKEIVEPRQKFFDTLRSFMNNKKFSYNNKTSELVFSLDEHSTEPFPWSNLSSGEKQLLIQFMEVLLQEGRSLIFIADEPELSLHVLWQEKLLKALRALNENAQLIVATHSPDIVADYSHNVVDMRTVISNNV